MNHTWLSTSEITPLAGISPRAIQLAMNGCAEGKTWQDAAVVVRRVAGRGGNSGQVIEARLDTLPWPIQVSYWQARATPPLAPPRKQRYLHNARNSI